METPSTLPLQPFEELNAQRAVAPTDVETQNRTLIAREVFLAGIVTGRIDPNISSSQLNLFANIAVDAADILLKRLAGKR